MKEQLVIEKGVMREIQKGVENKKINALGSSIGVSFRCLKSELRPTGNGKLLISIR